VLDGNALANPSLDGEIRAMKNALEAAHLPADEIGYINAHATASVLGDEIECSAIAAAFGQSLSRITVNSSKSLLGHCLYAAGVVELVATLQQLNEGFLHPNLNLDHPLTTTLNFAPAISTKLEARAAISNSFGFGGINSSVVVAAR
jgi:malonyl-ACP decarboxylase